MQDERHLSWEFHRNYSDIVDLYGDLCRVVSDICLEDSQIVIHYHSETMVVKACHGGFSVVWNNGKPDVLEDQDIYCCVLDFVHELTKKPEVYMRDSSIVRIDGTGLQYKDEMGRFHFLNLADVIEVKEPRLGKPTGSILFRTTGAPVRFDFVELLVPGKRRHAFTGGRAKRWASLKKALKAYQSQSSAEGETKK